MNPQALRMVDFTYVLPDERIAHYPLEARDQSKLLVYKDGVCNQKVFNSLADELPNNSLLVFNDTKVIQARILFIGEKDTIEVFCLEPMQPSEVIELAMGTSTSCIWKCLIGNNKRWKELPQLATFNDGADKVKLTAEKLRKEDDYFVVKFSWEPANLSFARVLEIGGRTPLPPYIKRDTEDADKDRYQTVYARAHGSVAAPTAGLHFTKEVIDSLAAKNITTTHLTLHVGAGTFKPVKADYLREHEMHAEQIHVTKELINALIATIGNHPIVPVGTTALRTLESLYWLGLKLRHYEGEGLADISIEQWEPYDINPSLLVEPRKALESIAAYMKEHKLTVLHGKTRLLIAPGYKFKFADAVVTNFHQPQSTLLLLIAALIGSDWKKVYDYALANDFRFLSYGDSSLLFKA
jgi:S-adenosylmethionine:tRNA ribosyltransferase-isomerase